MICLAVHIDIGSLLKYYVNLYYGKLGRFPEKERGGWKLSLQHALRYHLILPSHRSLLMGKATGKKTSQEHPRGAGRCRCSSG